MKRESKGLVREFAARSFAVALLVVLAVGWVVTQAVEAAILRGVEGSASIAAASLAHHLGDGQLQYPLADDSYSEFDETVRKGMLRGEVTAIKLWSPDGRLLYSSNNPQDEGATFEEHEEILRVLAGEIITEISEGATPEDATESAGAGQIIEVYVPVVAERSTDAIGVYELYMPMAPVRQAVARADRQIWLVVILCSLAAYFIQVGIVRRAERRVTESEAEVEEVNARLQESLAEIEAHSLGTLQALTAAVDAKDAYTARHALAVTDYSVAIGLRLGLDARTLADLERASLLHDIGKIGVPESILSKPSGLTDEEYVVVKRHSDIGADIVESIPFLAKLAPAVRHHHERWDGRGYPDGLAGEAIPVLARILGVADAFDAMTSDRPYRKGMSFELALKELRAGKLSQFCPVATEAMIQALDAGEIARSHHHTRASADRQEALAS